jgi:GNAT superfamily N-acetyltransferase
MPGEHYLFEVTCDAGRLKRNMNVTIETATNAGAMRAACYVREQVFGKQCYRRLPRLDAYDPAQILTLVVRSADTNDPIATLSVVETTDDSSLHNSLGLRFPDGERVARYTQLAVLKPYRGLRVPVFMVSEARRRFVAPNRFAYTWLLFDADTAKSSSFCEDLGFRPGARVFATEYGRSRVLVKKEDTQTTEPSSPEPATLSCRNGSANGFLMPHLSVFPRAILEDEWLAQ